MKATSTAMLNTISKVTDQMLSVLVPGDESIISTPAMSVYTAKDKASDVLNGKIEEKGSSVELPNYCDLVNVDDEECSNDDQVVSVSVSTNYLFDNL